MSRLIIKGIPTRYEDKHLRELFSFAGEVTDAKIIKTRDGKSRQFGFVGFRTSTEAKAARHRLDKSYVDTGKVSVEFAHAIGANTIPRPWSKYSKGSSVYEKKNQESEAEKRKLFLKSEAKRNKENAERRQREKKNEISENDKAVLKEFQETASRRSSKPIWADGGIQVEEKSTLVASKKRGGEGKMLERKHVTFDVDDSDADEDELYDELPKTAKEVEGSQKDISEKEGEDDEKNIAEEDNARNKVAMNEKVSDLDYFKSKVVQIDNVDQENADAEPEDESDRKEKDVDEESSSELSSEKRDTEEQDKVGQGKQTAKHKAENDGQGDKPQAGYGAEEKKNTDVNESKDEDPLRKKKEELLKINPGDTGRLMVRNLAYSMTEEELEAVFEPFGTLSEVHLVKDNRTRKSRGMGFIQYIIPEHAPKAIMALDGTIQNGRILHILPAKPRPVPLKLAQKRKPSNLGETEFKNAKEEARRDAAKKGLDNIAQHALHMSSDAVAEVIAERNKVTKAELYGVARDESGIAAVRLAMGEAMLQSETRQFLLENGIDLEAATRANLQDNASTAAAKRKRLSRTAFLAKNLPAKSTEKELKEVFSNFGPLERLLVVPSGLLAVVEYENSSNAKHAYNSLAYTKFRDTPLYLEWLPRTALNGVSQTKRTIQSTQQDAAQIDVEEAGQDQNMTEEEERVRNATVYVKNLNFDTRDAALKAHFVKVLRRHSNLGSKLRSAKVAMKRGSDGKESDRLSMGFGFLEFSSQEVAIEVVKLGQNTVLDGHTLQLRISKQGSEDKPLQKRKRSGMTAKAGPKLIVRNVAFQATKQDIKSLFSSFGQLKNVRIPRKMDGTHRGFAFVEFTSKSEAKSAFEALASAHLYGRHLVLEYAEENADAYMSIGELQAKAEANMAKKRIKMIEGSAKATEDGNDAEGDEQAMIEDEMYV